MNSGSPTSAAGLGRHDVIMGRLIPAGTGLPPYKRLNVIVDDKAPSYMPPVIPKVTPAELSSAVGEE